jgi:hypothetical protein
MPPSSSHTHFHTYILEQLVYKQFRFKEIVDEDGSLLLEQEHEVRMTAHPSCPLKADT